MKRIVLPSLVIAAGTVVGTALSVLAADSGWLVLAGPLLLAATTIGTSALWVRSSGGTHGSLRTAIVLSAIFLVTGLILWLRNPGDVPLAVATMGGAAAVGLGMPRRCGRARPDTAPGA